MSHAAGVGDAAAARDRPGDAPAAGEHARARPQRLPAAARRPAPRLPRRRASTRSCPAQGSVGASGDLAPLAHLALPLIGRGQVELHGQPCPRSSPSARPAWSRSCSRPKEGLALLNGTQLMTAHRGARCSRMPTVSPGRRASRRRCRVEALLGTDVAFAAAYQLARPHPGQIAVAAELRHLLRDSGFQTAHHGDEPQGPGPVLAALRAPGPRRGPRRARPPPAGPRHRDEQRDRQPARLPRGRGRAPRTRPRRAAAG